MPPKNNQKNYLELVNLLKENHPDIFETLISSETAFVIDEIVNKYKLEEPGEFKARLKNIQNIAEGFEAIKDLAGTKIADILKDVLIGRLPPDEIAKTLKKELKISADLAKNIDTEIQTQIIAPIQGSLNNLYGIESAATTIIKGPPETPSKDTYREIIE